MAIYSNSRIQLRLDNEAGWNSNNPTIESGEICLSADKYDFKVGTGTNWRSGSYWIANNPKVVDAYNNADNAVNTADAAAQRADDAWNLADDAIRLAKRHVDSGILKDMSAFGTGLTIDDAFVEEWANTDFILVNGVLGGANPITINANTPLDSGNELRFYFSCSEPVGVWSPWFSYTMGPDAIAVIGDQRYDDVTKTITFNGGDTVEMCYINGCVLKYRVHQMNY